MQCFCSIRGHTSFPELFPSFLGCHPLEKGKVLETRGRRCQSSCAHKEGICLFGNKSMYVWNVFTAYLSPLASYSEEKRLARASPTFRLTVQLQRKYSLLEVWKKHESSWIFPISEKSLIVWLMLAKLGIVYYYYQLVRDDAFIKMPLVP